MAATQSQEGGLKDLSRFSSGTHDKHASLRNQAIQNNLGRDEKGANNVLRGENQKYLTKPRNQIDILLSSSLSCILTMTLTNPLEVVKLKAQYSPMSCQNYPHPSFKDLYNCACTRFNLKDSFKGLHLNLFQGLISAVLYMQVYQYCRGNALSYFSDRNKNSRTQTNQTNFNTKNITNFQSSLATLGSAFTSRILVTSLLVPVEAMRVRFTNTSTPLSQQNILSSQTNKGLKVTMVRDLSYSCLLWFTIQSIRNMLVGQQYRYANSQGSTETQKQSVSSSFITDEMKKVLFANVIPAFVGANLISILTTPLDTIKTRIQSGIDLGENQSITRQMRAIYRREGMTGLFSGVQYRAVKNSISSVFYITMYEYFLEKISQNKTKSQQ